MSISLNAHCITLHLSNLTGHFLDGCMVKIPLFYFRHVLTLSLITKADLMDASDAEFLLKQLL